MNRRSHRATRLSTLAVVLLVIAATAGGCAQMRRWLGAVVERPVVTFEALGVRDVSLTGLTLDLTWKVENPNAVGLKLRRLTYAFDVEGRRFTSGRQNEGIDVGAHSASLVTLPFEIRFSELAGSVASLLTRDDIAWNAEGSIAFGTPIGTIAVPFQRDGRTALPRLPDVRLGSVRLTNVSFSGASLAVNLDLGNPNGFTVPLESLDYSISVAGANVASGRARPPSLPPGERRTISIPVRISFAGLGAATQEAIRTGRANLVLQGSLDSGPVELPINLAGQVRLR